VTGKVVCHVGVQTQILGKLGKNLFHYRAKVRTEKAIFVALSYFRYDVARNCNVAEVRACVRAVLLAAEQRPRSCSLIRLYCRSAGPSTVATVLEHTRCVSRRACHAAQHP
jgi:hypothetical protein